MSLLLSVQRYVQFSLTLAEAELRKIRHESTELFTRAVQPIFWLLVFGSVFSRIRGIVDVPYSYLQFMTPGVLAQSVLFVSIFYGITLVWERDLGLLNKMLASPAPHSAIVVGKAFAAGTRSILQAVMVYAFAMIIHVNLTTNILQILAVFIVIVIFGMCLSSLSMLFACWLRTRERLMGMVQAITMPLFLASNAIYPIALMPVWLQYISAANPMTYVVDAMRALLLTNDFSHLPLDFLVLGLYTLVLIGLASVSFKRLVS